MLFVEPLAVCEMPLDGHFPVTKMMKTPESLIGKSMLL